MTKEKKTTETAKPAISEEVLNKVIGTTKKAMEIGGEQAKEIGINNDKVLEVLESLRGETNTTATALATTLFLILPAEALGAVSSMLSKAIQVKLIEKLIEGITESDEDKE